MKQMPQLSPWDHTYA